MPTSPATSSQATTATTTDLNAVLFDIDGVLLDSLPQHLAIARDQALEQGLSIEIPSVDAFRAKIAAGAIVSPMLQFFLTLGFPEKNAQTAVSYYEKEFQTRYHPPAIAGIEAALDHIAAAGLKIGLVTSNLRANIEPALGASFRYFDPRLSFFYDTYDPPRAKSTCLTEAARILQCAEAQCLYIGDQPTDQIAATQAGCQFLGVTYGWGITPATSNIETAGSISEVASKLIAKRSRRFDDKSPSPPTLIGTPLELSKLRFDYAWKFFSFHATQRTQMFNFMLLLVGILAASLTGSIDKGLVEPALTVSAIGIIVAFIFLKLDRRNRDLVRTAESVLNYLETGEIFSGKERYTPPRAPEQALGIFIRRAEIEDAEGRGLLARLRRGEHRILLPLFAGIVAVFFTAALLWVAYSRDSIRARAPAPPGPPTSASSQPANLGDLATQIINYHNTGAYDRDLWAVIKPAEEFLTERASQVKAPALVLDIDETSLSNWPKLIANSFAYFPNGPCDSPPTGPCGETAWEQLAQASPISATLDLYNLARAKHIAVFFVTGRPEALRKATEDNLRAAGYTTWEGLIMRPPNTPNQSIADFKAPARRQIEQQGFTIIANVGDQPSDLAGGHAERTYLVPDPYYRIP